jgi:hypothetical protein
MVPPKNRSARNAPGARKNQVREPSAGVKCVAARTTMTLQRKVLEMSGNEHLPVAQSVRLGAPLVVE